MLSDFANGSFGKDYGVSIADGAFANLHSKAIVVVDGDGKVVYTEQVPEIAQEEEAGQAQPVVSLEAKAMWTSSPGMLFTS